MNELIDLAIENAKKAYCPYSNLYVGCVLVTKEGKLYTGFNIENASYPNGSCAEKNAFINAIINEKKDFDKIVIVGGKNKMFNEYCFPCGSCRQFMSEFVNDDFEIIVAKENYEYEVYTLGELFKKGFDLK